MYCGQVATGAYKLNSNDGQPPWHDLLKSSAQICRQWHDDGVPSPDIPMTTLPSPSVIEVPHQQLLISSTSTRASVSSPLGGFGQGSQPNGGYQPQMDEPEGPGEVLGSDWTDTIGVTTEKATGLYSSKPPGLASTSWTQSYGDNSQ